MIAYNRKTAYAGNSARDGLYILDIQCEKKENCISKNNGPFAYIGSFAWSPDNKHLAGTSDGTIKIYNYNENRLSIAETLSNIDYTYEIIWSKDNKFLVLSTKNNTSLYSFDKKIIEQIDLPNGSLVSDWILFP
jgi:WD40 repeat protein